MSVAPGGENQAGIFIAVLNRFQRTQKSFEPGMFRGTGRGAPGRNLSLRNGNHFTAATRAPHMMNREFRSNAIHYLEAEACR